MGCVIFVDNNKCLIKINILQMIVKFVTVHNSSVSVIRCCFNSLMSEKRRKPICHLRVLVKPLVLKRSSHLKIELVINEMVLVAF